MVRCWLGGWDDPFPCLSWLPACLLLCAPVRPRSIGVPSLNNTFTSVCVYALALQFPKRTMDPVIPSRSIFIRKLQGIVIWAQTQNLNSTHLSAWMSCKISIFMKLVAHSCGERKTLPGNVSITEDCTHWCGLFDKRPSVLNNSLYQQYRRERSWPFLWSTMFPSKHLVVCLCFLLLLLLSVSCLGLWFFSQSALPQHKPLQSCSCGLDVWFVEPGGTALGGSLVRRPQICMHFIIIIK